MKKLLFYGASVTHQQGDSGYIKNVSESLGSYKCISLAYPATHFNDAGYYYHELVIHEKPDFCILEWNTTSSFSFDEEKIKLVLQKFISKGITPAFLILPRIGTNYISDEPNDRVIETQAYAFSEIYQIPLLDLRNLKGLNLLLRDEVHTNMEGARVYSKAIVDWVSGQGFYEVKNDINICQEYGKLSFLKYEKPLNIFKKICIETNVTGKLSELAFTGSIGPYSPLLKVTIPQLGMIEIINVLDPWCYYERKSTLTLFKKLGSVKFELSSLTILIEVMNEAPDYSCIKSSEFKLPNVRFLSIDELIFSDIEANSSKIELS